MLYSKRKMTQDINMWWWPSSTPTCSRTPSKSYRLYVITKEQRQLWRRELRANLPLVMNRVVKAMSSTNVG